MRIVGVVSEAHHAPGVYGQGQQLDARTLERIRSAQLARGMLTTLSASLVAPQLIPLGFQVINALLANNEMKRLGPLPGETDSKLLPPAGGIVIPAARARIGGLQAHRDPLFYGLFRSRRELRRSFSAEGGNVDLWILPISVAQDRFRHHGGVDGTFSLGLYLPHPKDPDVLVPAREFSQILRDQVLQDWVRAFEALGASKTVICDTTTARASTTVGTRPSGADVAAELKAQYGAEVVRESSYGPGTFDCVRACEGKRWIDDFAAIQSIVEGRVKGRQLSYRERVRIDLSFGLDIKALGTWEGMLDGGYTRTYELAVEFHPKKTESGLTE